MREENPEAVGETATDGRNAERETGTELRIDDLEITRAQASMLENPTRRRIVEHLRETPGLNKNQLRCRLDVLRNTLEFHVGRLEDQGLVVTKRRAESNEVLCFLAADEHLWEEEQTRVLFGRSSNRQVALFVEEHPGSSTEEIAQAVGLEPVTVLHHLKTLREHGLVQRIRKGNDVNYYPEPSLEAWVADFDESYLRPWHCSEG